MAGLRAIMVGSHIMKTSPILALITVVACATFASAAPAVSTQDLSPSTLKTIANPRQAKSLKIQEEAEEQAKTARAKEMEEVRKITSDNDAGMKKTIQKRALNNMLPACERDSETPRDPAIYTIR